MRCPHCNADLTKTESVVRWWGSYGHYKPVTSWEGGFVETEDCYGENYHDACTNCGGAIDYKEVFKNA